jgi:cytochrome c553
VRIGQRVLKSQGARHAVTLATGICGIPYSSRLAYSPDVLEEGRARWADHCASCHANNGSAETPNRTQSLPQSSRYAGAPIQQLS